MNMYVSNLGFHVSSDDLRKLFESYGDVSNAKVVMDRETGRSRGFGFVEMASNDQAEQAISNINGKELEGRFLSVSIARQKTDRKSSSSW